MKAKEYPSQEYLNSILEYRDGELYWKKCHVGITQGGRAGCLNKTRGYRSITINRIAYMEHRIVWIIINGDIPSELQIDHINRIKNDNRIENLRLVNRSLNQMNRNSKNVRPGSVIPYRGYYAVNGKEFSKSFHTEQEAIEWVDEKKSEIFEEQGLTWARPMI